MSKRLFDLFVTSIGLLVAAPVMAVVALTLLASPDGLALAVLLSGLDRRRRRRVLALMTALGEPTREDQAA